MIKNGFSIKYWVFPSCIKGAKCNGAKAKGKLMLAKHKGPPTQKAIFFICSGKRYSMLLYNVVLHVLYERLTFAPVSTPAECNFGT